MKTVLCIALSTLFLCAIASAQAQAPTVASVYDHQLSGLEREFVSLAEAVPADKYGFAPSNGQFTGVRTFGQQVSHAATALYMFSSSILGEKNPIAGSDENGPASLKTKDDIIKYLKDAFAYTHKAMNSLTAQNLTDMVAAPFGDRKVPRMAMANLALAHSFDHYGQMVVYARMNGIVPPASRPASPPAKPAK